MHKPRTVKRPGPLLHQQRLHSARQHERSAATQRGPADMDFAQALQKAVYAPPSEGSVGTVRWVFSDSLTGSPEVPVSVSGSGD